MRMCKFLLHVLLIACLILWRKDVCASDTIPALREVFREKFLIGAAVSPRNIYSAEGDILQKHFNSLTAENVMKMGLIHPEPNRYAWAGPDSIVAYARTHGMKLRGHTLVWHKQTPRWLFMEPDGRKVSKEKLLARLREHIFAVVSRYRGQIYAWDVLNEAISDDPGTFYTRTPFLEICGEEFIEKIFRWAHEADPQALLFYNDYRETDPVKRKKIIELVTRLRDKGVPIHGIGLQGHWSIHHLQAQALEDCLKDFAATGLILHITELDLSVWPGEADRREIRPEEHMNGYTKENARKQDALYGMIFSKFLKYSNAIQSVTFWNITDRHSWLDEWPVRGRKDHPLLFDANLQPKFAFWKVVEQIRY
jgi:endo-1,4-beta-xylanase